MRVCLINPSSPNPGWRSAQPPLGLLYLAAVLEKKGHEVALLDREVTAVYSVKEKIKELKPDVVGLTAVTPTITDAYDVAEKVRAQRPDIPIIIGGPHASAIPERTLEECPAIDYLVKGEGEITFLELVETIANGQDIRKVGGVYYRENGKFRRTAPRLLIKNIDDIPFPARRLLNRQHYFRPSDSCVRGVFLVATTVITSRGCPFQCTFCSGHMVHQRTTRFHSPDYVVEELEQLVRDFDIKGAFFSDDLWAVNKKRAAMICEAMIKKGLHKKIKWTSQLRADLVDKEILALMKRAGAVQADFGFESGSQRILDFVKKKATVEQNRQAAKIAKELGIRVLANILLGVPGETAEDLRQTYLFLKETKPDFISANLLVPLPGTELWDMARDRQWLITEDWASFRQDLFGAPTLKDDDRTALEIDTMYKTFLRRVATPRNTASRLTTMLRKNPLRIIGAYRDIYLCLRCLKERLTEGEWQGLPEY